MTHTILVVEDNPITQKMMTVALRSAGYRVFAAGDGQRALELAAAKHPDVVVEDLVLPDMDGIELGRRIRALSRGKDMILVALSGLVAKLEQARGIDPGFAQLLFKPVEPSRLVELLATLLPTPCTGTRVVGEHRRILFVDDDTQHRKLYRIQLEEHGFQVRTAATGQEALDALQREIPDAVVSDHLMPGMDGLDLCRAMRSEPALAHIPFVLTSAGGVSVDELDQKMAHRAGVSALVPRTPDLRHVVEALLASLATASQPPPPPAVANGEVDHLAQEYTGRILRTLEHQAELSETLAHDAACKTAQLAIMTAVAGVIAQGHDLHTTLSEVLARTLDAAGVSTGAIYLADTDQQIRLACQLGYPISVAQRLEQFFGRPELLTEVLATRRVISVPADGTGHPMSSEATPVEDQADNALRCMLLPLITQGEPYGVLVMASAHRDLGARWLAIVQVIGGQIAQAIALARSTNATRESEAQYRTLAIEREVALTEAEAARCAAETANASKARFLAVMSHELRTPLNAISGYVDLLQMGLRGPVTSGQSEDLRRVRLNAQHLLRMIGEILDHVQLDAGRVPIQNGGVSLASVLLRTEALVTPQFREKGLWLSIEECDPAYAVRADFVRLVQVLVNLLTNALKFTPAGGSVLLTSEIEDDRVAIRVTDTGPGIAPENLERIFEAFFQIDRSLTRAHGGVGLGLAISRDIIRTMGGDIQVISTLGAGSVFTVTLPRAARVEHTLTPSQSWPAIPA